MNETIDYSIVFAKTPKGVAEINARSGALTLPARRVLIMIDGHRPVAELMAVVRTGEFDGIMSTLETQAMIEKVDPASLSQRDYEADDFADTISLLQENAAALRSLPHVNPATVAQPRPATITNEQSADAAAIAARAVATASAPRPIDPPVRRPPTISTAAPVTTRDMASGTARPGTLNVTIKSPDPVRRPPTLSGARPEQSSDPTGAAVESPSRTAPTPAPAPVPAAAEAAPAPASLNTRPLEEEKRFAVSELYSVLGPYGEQSAARLQECTTAEALREQIKQAGRRVATFRGEKAAEDYLRAVGYA